MALTARCVFLIDFERDVGLLLHLRIHQLILVCALTGARTSNPVYQNDALTT